MSGPLGSSQWMYATAAGFYSYKIGQSLRFNDNDSAYLSFTPSSAGNRATWTWSAWVKRSTLDGNATLFCSAAGDYNLKFHTDNKIKFEGAHGEINTAAIFRDVSAWYHIVAIHDTTEGSASDRFKIYVNGVLQTTSGTYPSGDGVINSTTSHGLGGQSSANFFDGYMAEVHFIDGTAVAATSFGETKDGVWIPKAYSGSYGTYGWHLDFADSSDIGNNANTTDGTNDWTPNNLAATDVVLDTPSGNNFATMNDLYHSGAKGTLSEGSLKVSTGGFVNTAHGYGAVSTFAIPKDKKIYIEVECTDQTGVYWTAGFATQSGLESGPSSTTVGGSNAITYYNRSVYVNGSETDYGSSAGLGGLGVATMAAGDILGCMIDGATGKVWFSRNGSYFKSPSTNNSGTTGDPAGGNHEIGTITNGTTEDVFFLLQAHGSTNNLFVNFGQDSTNVASANADANGLGTFEYAPPTGYVCLASSSLTEPTIGPGQDEQADDNFNTVLYTGNASSRSITGVGFQPDWVWFKPRSDTDNNVVFDSVRGVQKFIYVNGTGVEGTRSGDGLSSFDSDGFSIGDWNNLNESSQTYVAWNWKAGGSASSNSDGSTTSSVSANTDAGFSILTYTADAATGTVGHGLNSAPELVIGRPRSDTNWYVMHTPGGVVPANNILNLDSNAAAFNPGANHFNDTYPTSTVVNYGGYMGNDLSNDNKLMYCFHSVEGYSKVGSFLGNGSSQFVYLGFRPAFVLWKRTNSSGWNISDSVRDPFNEVSAVLHPNTTASETTASQDILFVSNGFVEAGYANDSGTTSIYWAIAEAPFKYANAR